MLIALGRNSSLLFWVLSNFSFFQLPIASGKFYNSFRLRLSYCSFEHWARLEMSAMLLFSRWRIFIYFHIVVGMFFVFVPSKSWENYLVLPIQYWGIFKLLWRNRPKSSFRKNLWLWHWANNLPLAATDFIFSFIYLPRILSFFHFHRPL